MTGTSEPDRTLRRRRIDDPPTLEHLDLATHREAPRRGPRPFHKRPPIIRHHAGGLARADRRPASTGLEKGADLGFEPPVEIAGAIPTTPIGAVPDVVPVTGPLATPLDTTTAGIAETVGHVGHGATLGTEPGHLPSGDQRSSAKRCSIIAASRSPSTSQSTGTCTVFLFTLYPARRWRTAPIASFPHGPSRRWPVSTLNPNT